MALHASSLSAAFAHCVGIICLLPLPLMIMMHFVRFIGGYNLFGSELEDDCYLSIRHRYTTPEDMRYYYDGYGNVEKYHDRKDCAPPLREFDGCQTFRCIDRYGNDIFVLNHCAEKDRKCTGIFYTFCGQVNGTSSCDVCTDMTAGGTQICNWERISLQTPHPTPKVMPDTTTTGVNVDLFEPIVIKNGAGMVGPVPISPIILLIVVIGSGTLSLLFRAPRLPFEEVSVGKKRNVVF